MAKSRPISVSKCGPFSPATASVSRKWRVFNCSTRSALFAVAVATLGLLLAYQGWNSRPLNFDLIPYADDAQDLVSQRRIPEKGTLTSFASYTPPGIAWMMAPGAYLFDDPRLFESVGCAILYVATLIAVFLLARTCLGTRGAYLAALLWGLSELALIFAESSRARAHPFFYAWMVYFIIKWVETNSARWLAASLLTWAVGMYVFLEFAPALFIVPIVWFVYRPSVRIGPLMVTAILVSAVWYPYLRFEAGRHFSDLGSQVLRQRVDLNRFAEFWCNPALVPSEWRISPPESLAGVKVAAEETARGKVVSFLGRMWAQGDLVLRQLLVANFNHAARYPGISVLLLLLTVIGLLVLSFQIILHGPRSGPWLDLLPIVR